MLDPELGGLLSGGLLGNAYKQIRHRQEAIDAQVDAATGTQFNQARNLVVRVDPLVLDLDGDGIELVSASGTVLFDHNADGIKTGTGWATGGDGFLVRDLDNDGAISTGRELFGVDTIKSNNSFATDGFDALRDLDSDGDGFITAADAAYGELKIWQDTNQDGISQSTELKTLAELSISSIGVNGTAAGPQAGQVINSNLVALSTTFTQDGQTHTVGAIDLEANNFFTEFPSEVVDEAGNPVPITVEAQELPQMNGSGMVRNMQAAASLSEDFAAALTTYAATSTREGQRSQLDNLVTLWAETSGFTGGIFSSNVPAANVSLSFNLPAGITVTQYKNLINVLEAFNGSHFYGNAEGGPRPAGFAVRATTEPGNTNVVYQYTISPPAQQVALLQQAYDALKESVYGALVVQTRLRPYLDAIELVVDETGLRFDPSASIGLAQEKAAVGMVGVVRDLVDLKKYANEISLAAGWSVYSTLNTVLRSAAMTPELQNVLAQERIQLVAEGALGATAMYGPGTILLGNSSDNALAGSTGADYLLGGDGNDTLTAVGGGDTLDGGAGDDLLNVSSAFSGTGTTYIGGTGNDTMIGTYANDTYIFNLGDGQDTITDYSAGFANTDVLTFGAGIAAADVTPVRSGLDLIFKVAGGTDQITVKNWFNDSTRYYQIEQIRFDDGTVWTNSQVNTRALEVFGTAGNDTLSGVSAFADVLRGGDGNDTLTAVGGGDTLDGGAGDDLLNVSSAFSGTGTTYIGGTGNDTMIGTYANDTYIFNLGDGQDTITDYSAGFANTDVLTFGAGIAADQLWFTRNGNDLNVSVIGSTDKVSIGSWYLGNLYHVEQFKTSDGKTLLDSQVQNLVQAMASFAPPAAGETTLPANYADTLNPVLAANWQ
ncbi:MAG: calcium-binding protein [Polaromonas sp.]